MIALDWSQSPGDAFVSDRAERALLGVLLLVGAASLDICSRLKPEDFRAPHRAALLQAVRRLAFHGTPVDAVTVLGELERRHALPPSQGWAVAVSSLLDDGNVGSADDESVRAYAEIVREGSLTRRSSDRRRSLGA